MHPKQQNSICRRFSMWNLPQKYYKRLHCEALHHIFSSLLIPAVFFFISVFLQNATSSWSLWEALPAPSIQPLRLPRYITQTSSGGWHLLVSQKQRMAFIHLFVTSVAVNGCRKSFCCLLSNVHQSFSEPSEKTTISGHTQAFQLMVLSLKKVQLFFPSSQNDPFGKLKNILKNASSQGNKKLALIYRKIAS